MPDDRIFVYLVCEKTLRGHNGLMTYEQKSPISTHVMPQLPYLCSLQEVVWRPRLLLWQLTQHRRADLAQHGVDSELHDIVRSLHEQVEFGERDVHVRDVVVDGDGGPRELDDARFDGFVDLLEVGLHQLLEGGRDLAAYSGILHQHQLESSSHISIQASINCNEVRWSYTNPNKRYKL